MSILDLSDQDEAHITEQIVNDKLLSMLSQEDQQSENVNEKIEAKKKQITVIIFKYDCNLVLKQYAFHNFTKLENLFGLSDENVHTIETNAFRNIGTELEETKYFKFPFKNFNDLTLQENAFENVKFKWIHLNKLKQITAFNIPNATFICKNKEENVLQYKEKIIDLNASVIFKQEANDTCKTIYVKSGNNENNNLLIKNCIFSIKFDIDPLKFRTSFDFLGLLNLNIINQAFENCEFNFPSYEYTFQNFTFTSCKFINSAIRMSENVVYKSCTFEHTTIKNASETEWINCDFKNLRFSIDTEIGFFRNCKIERCQNINKCIIAKDSQFSNLQYITHPDLNSVPIDQIPYVFLVSDINELNIEIINLITNGLQRFDIHPGIISEDAKNLHRAINVYHIVHKKNFEQYFSEENEILRDDLKKNQYNIKFSTLLIHF